MQKAGSAIQHGNFIGTFAIEVSIESFFEQQEIIFDPFPKQHDGEDNQWEPYDSTPTIRIEMNEHQHHKRDCQKESEQHQSNEQTVVESGVIPQGCQQFAIQVSQSQRPQ